MSRSHYQIGSAMLFDKQITRAEAIAEKATGAIKGVKGAVIAAAVVQGVSTMILVGSALRSSTRRRARG